MQPPIGVHRIYEGPEIPMIYPGERATSAAIPAEDIERLIDEAVERGDDHITIHGAQWIVEPEPDWRGAWLRWRYRFMTRPWWYFTRGTW